jgi:hypothetical protein
LGYPAGVWSKLNTTAAIDGSHTPEGTTMKHETCVCAPSPPAKQDRPAKMMSVEKRICAKLYANIEIRRPCRGKMTTIRQLNNDLIAMEKQGLLLRHWNLVFTSYFDCIPAFATQLIRSHNVYLSSSQ